MTADETVITIPSPESLVLGSRLASTTDADPGTNIDDVRRDLDEEFAPRAARALTRFGVTTAEQRFGGVDCLVVSPRLIKTSGILCYFFGGGYVSGAPEYELPIVASLVDKVGCVAILPRYPLAPESPFPAAVDAADEVYRALIVFLEGRSLVLAGESAGGGLALSLVQRLQASACVMPDGICLFSPWSNLHPEALSAPHPAINDPSLARNSTALFAAAYVGDGDCARAEVSPYFGHYDASYPATFVTTGTRDSLLPNAVELTQKMRLAGVEADLRVWSSMWHVFEIYDELPEAELSLGEAATFIARYLGEH